MHLIKTSPVTWLTGCPEVRALPRPPLLILPAALPNPVCFASTPLPGEEAMAISRMTRSEDGICHNFTVSPCF